LYQKTNGTVHKIKLENMKRTVINIDEDKCNGCGACVPGCHEGALQIIDGKARLISDLMCDGLGACIGHCPMDAITLEEREAEPYDEILVMEGMIGKGFNTIFAHLKHLKDHDMKQYVRQGVDYLRANRSKIDFDPEMLLAKLHEPTSQPVQPKVDVKPMPGAHHHGSGCPGSREMSFKPQAAPAPVSVAAHASNQPSELRQWPVQLHLLNPAAGYLANADLLVAADCSAFAVGDFHSRFLAGKVLAIACPKLDSGMDVYVEKLRRMIDESKINTITVLIMEVPCCGGLIQIIQKAVLSASRKVPVKAIVVSVQGDVISEQWV
jgi:ferredoxin